MKIKKGGRSKIGSKTAHSKSKKIKNKKSRSVKKNKESRARKKPEIKSSSIEEKEILIPPESDIEIKPGELEISHPPETSSEGPPPPAETLMDTGEDSENLEVTGDLEEEGETPVPEVDSKVENFIWDSDLSEDFAILGGEESWEETNETQGVERLGFFLADEEYAIELLGIQEIIRHVEITPVPRSEKSISGIISLRGTVIPIYDIRGRLGLDIREVGRQTRIVVVKLEKGLVGLIVDKISGVVMIPDQFIKPPPTTSGGTTSEHLKGVASIGDRMVILLNLEKAVTLE